MTMSETVAAAGRGSQTPPKKDAEAAAAGRRIRLAQLRDLALLPAIGLILVVGSFIDPYFLTRTNLVNVLQQQSEISLVVLGQVLVMIAGKLDLSLESTVGLAPGIAVWLILPVSRFHGQGLELPGFWAVPIALAVGALVGAVNGLLMVRFKLSGFIVTLGMLITLRGLLNGISKGQTFFGLPHSMTYLGTAIWLGLPAWRWMFWMQAIPAGVFLLSLLLIPESPRFLVLKGREQEAEQVLSRLFGAGAGAQKVAEIRASLAADHHRPRFSDLIDKTTRKIRPIVWAGLGLAIFQQLVGINIVFYYGAVLWQSVGFSEDDSLKINILSGTLSILACLAAIAVIDRIGRKPLLLIGSAGMTVTLGTMAGCFATATMTDGALQLSDQVGLIALIAANAYVVFFNMSWGPVMWVMLGEMFPTQIRGSGLAVAGFAQWMANFLISVSFPALAAGLGLPITYGFYAVSALVSFFFVQAMVRETRGRELEAMEG